MTIQEFEELKKKQESIKYLAGLVNYAKGLPNKMLTNELMVGIDMILDEILPIAEAKLEELKREFESYQKVSNNNK